MGDPAPASAPEGGTTVHYLVPDGCVHVFGEVSLERSLVREAQLPLENGTHTFPVWF